MIGGIVNPLTQCLSVTNMLVCCSVFFQCAAMAIAMKAARMGSLWLQCLSASLFPESWAAFDNNLSFAGRSQETDCWKGHSISALSGCSACVSCLGWPYSSVPVLKWKSWQRARASIKPLSVSSSSSVPSPFSFIAFSPFISLHHSS